MVTVRTGSSRLPQKALRKILDQATIEYVIERALRSKQSEGVVLCTTTLKEDDVLCEIAERHGAHYFRGSVKDKLERWNGACRKYGIEFFVTADGDDLFCEPELMDLIFSQYDRTRADYIEAGDGVICGAISCGISARSLARVCEIKGTDDTEMMGVYFKDTGLFKTEFLEGVDPVFLRDDIRMTLDYEDDFRFFETVAKALRPEMKNFSLREIISYLDQHPEVIQLNRHLHEKWKQNQVSKTKLILKENWNENN